MSEDALQAVKAEIRQVQRQVDRADYERETAAKAHQQALQNLKSLGVASEQEARQLFETMQAELAQELRRVQEELSTANE